MKWRIAVYVLIALLCSWFIGDRYGDKGMIIGVAVGIAIILVTFALAAFFIRRHMDWVRQHIGMLVGIFIVLQLLRILFNVFSKH